MKWTNEQNNAITIPVADTIVSAAAGSGKTAVMAERIIRRLTGENYVDIDKILVVTYTKAAASEIKERVMQKIVEKLSNGENPALSKQLVMLNNSHFCTIHSFCLDLLRKYFYKLDIDPEFGIADETEVKLIKNSAVEFVVDEYYNNHDQNFLSLVSHYSSRSDKAISEMILKVFDFSKTMPDSSEWLDSLCEFYGPDNLAVFEFLKSRIVSYGEYACRIYEDALDICKKNENCTTWYNLIADELDLVKSAINENSYDAMFEAFSNIKFKRWSSPKDATVQLKELVKGKRDSAKEVVEKIISSYLFASPEQIRNDNANIFPFVKKIAEAVKKTDDVFSNLKRERNIVDFSDFEHMALKLLKNDDGTPSDIAFQISESFEEIYIDEYQDCNNIQNAIFTLISGAIRGCPNVYCVGDMKQSIYRFRDANPMIFRNKCDTYVPYENEKAGKYNKILLNSNFRSRQTILGFVNSVFNQLMSRECGELEYENSEWLNYGGGYEEVNSDIGNIDIDIIDESDSFDNGSGENNDNHMSKYEAEATYVANKIKSYISGGYMLFDKKKQLSRPAEYKDIVILMRSPSKIAPVFEQVFNNMGIPVYNEKSGGYFDSEEIVFLISLLKIIDNPDDDIALASVMKNPIFSFDENELLKFRIAYPKKNASFYSCVKNYISQYNDSLSDKCRNFMNSIEKWYDKSRYMDTDSFIGYLIYEIDYFTYLSLFPDYTMKKANVRYLLQKAKEFESTNFKGIFSFIRYIENTQAVSSPETAKILSENDNVVRIMSIHHSKGLEYPIVFLSCLGKKINKMDANASYVIHKEFGVGLKSIYKENAVHIQTVNRSVIREKINMETLSEELRVLYVALTRPTEKIVLTGCLKNAPGVLNKLEFMLSDEEEKINSYIISKCESLMAIILLAVLRSEGCQLDFKYRFKKVIADNCKYSISLINKCDISPAISPALKNNWESCFNGETEYYEKMCSMLAFSYPYSDASNIPGNITVTELKRMSGEDNGSYAMFDEISLSEPEFAATNKKLSGAQLGSLVHLVMENIDFVRYSSEEEVLCCIRNMCEKGIISENEYEAVDISAVYAFFESALGEMMIKNASTLVREFSFKYFMNASDVFDGANDEKMIVQGTVDAYYVDSDGDIVVVDYKTDKVGKGGAGEIATRYKVQLDYYADALEYITKKRVKEKYLYLFDTGEFIQL